jgi:hypothetical protein
LRPDDSHGVPAVNHGIATSADAAKVDPVQPEPAVLTKMNKTSPPLNASVCALFALLVPLMAPDVGAVTAVPTVSEALDVPPGKSITLILGGVVQVAVLRLLTVKETTCPALAGEKGIEISVFIGVDPKVLGPAPSGNSGDCSVAVDTKTPPPPYPPVTDLTGAENFQNPAVAVSGTSMMKGAPHWVQPGIVELFSNPYAFVGDAA